MSERSTNSVHLPNIFAPRRFVLDPWLTSPWTVPSRSSAAAAGNWWPFNGGTDVPLNPQMSDGNSSSLALGEFPQRQLPDSPPRGQPPQGFEVRRHAQLLKADTNKDVDGKAKINSLEWGGK